MYEGGLDVNSITNMALLTECESFVRPLAINMGLLRSEPQNVFSTYMSLTGRNQLRLCNELQSQDTRT
jgi:hypothetical protein